MDIERQAETHVDSNEFPLGLTDDDLPEWTPTIFTESDFVLGENDFAEDTVNLTVQGGRRLESIALKFDRVGNWSWSHDTRTFLSKQGQNAF